MGLLSSLLALPVTPWPARSAERLEVSIDDIVLPLDVVDLVSWVNGENDSRSELASWMQLLDRESRDGLSRLLVAPVLTRRSFGQQLLRSWAARPLLEALGELIRLEGGEPVDSLQVLTTLEQLLSRRPEVTTLDLLQALPGKQLRLDLDALVQASSRWRRQLKRHQGLLRDLGRDALVSTELTPANRASLAQSSFRYKNNQIRLPHRAVPLQVETWVPDDQRRDGMWLALMPGLGGNPEHFHWLARRVASGGWPVALLEHPGSDAAAVQALLQGRQPFDGTKALEQRLQDLAGVLQAQKDQRLPLKGERVVVAGHSLGALTALLSAGAEPREGVGVRCRQALKELPLTNLSRLLQCELAEGKALHWLGDSPEPAAVIGLNSLGSLVWANRQPSRLPIPLMLLGGTLDLITPPLDEQVGVFSALASHPASRVVVVEGASHFSPIRVGEPTAAQQNDDLFQLGEELVGMDPVSVQAVIGFEVIDFLEAVAKGASARESQHFRSGDLRWHRLNRQAAEDLSSRHQ